ncbi:hypothetical protein H5407_13250 [Mitsuaria sp. WAJ17]|nr:hypothetical protein [Mitsuaria sp. WAJ17]
MLLLAATPAGAQGQREPVVGLPCEGCEAVFFGMPAQLGARARIAPASEPGAPMVVTGRVLNRKGQAQAGVILYAYQTDSRGVYPELAGILDVETRRQGRLRGWVKTNASGRYTFDTIRPGSYPGEDVPEHIHFHVIEPGCATYYIDDIMFADDPKLTPRQVQRIARNRGGNGISLPVRQDGVWQVQRDIHLGRNIPGDPACGA